MRSSCLHAGRNGFVERGKESDWGISSDQSGSDGGLFSGMFGCVRGFGNC